MTTRLASFNLENLFSRPKVMNRATWAAGSDELSEFTLLSSLLEKPVYSDDDKTEIKRILDKHRFGDRNVLPSDRPFLIHEVRDGLFKVPQNSTEVEIVAAGRSSWVGWVDLTREELDPRATSFTGRVIREVQADVLCVVEVEDRLTLDRFNKQVISQDGGWVYPFNLLIDGNDPREIDVGLLSKQEISSVRSHIADVDAQGAIFSRDCAEFEVGLPGGDRLWVLANHFKSKGYGSLQASSRKRWRQAKQVAAIYQEARGRSPFVAVAGDLNDTPDSSALAPLVKDTDLKDVSEHPTWQGQKGTFKTGKGKDSKIDYILLSPALWQRVENVGIERRGIHAPSLKIMWPGVDPTTAASDHGAIWVDLDV
jgi:endonuclease/exonuclease/phosphatase family metal-dependent hydrolase